MVGPGPRVLVVDDDPSVRRFLRVALKAAGFSVFEAGSAGAHRGPVSAICHRGRTPRVAHTDRI